MTPAKRTNTYLPTFWDDFFPKDLMDWTNTNFADFDATLPAVNVKEDEDAYEIDVAVPGMDKEDFKINYANNLLTISSEKKEEKKEKGKKGKYSRREFSYQSFQRSFTIPENLVDESKIDATYRNGLLQIVLPKKEEVKPKAARQISIK